MHPKTILGLCAISAVLALLGCGQAPDIETKTPAAPAPDSQVQEKPVLVEPLSARFVGFRDDQPERGRVAVFSFTNKSNRGITRVKLEIELLDAEANLVVDPPPPYFLSGDPYWLAPGQTIEAEVGENLPAAAMTATVNIKKIVNAVSAGPEAAGEN